MMLYIILISFSSLYLSIASAVPQQTPFTNVTSTSSLGAPGTTNCPVQCTRNLERLYSLTWSPKTVTATHTVETVLLVINKRYNSTRTSRITNTEADLTGYTPAADVDSAGTRTTAIVVTTSNTVSTHTATFPTNFYADYASSYTVCGTLPTVVSGVATCIKHSCLHPTTYYSSPNFFDSGASTFAYPSHPPVPQTSSLAAIRGADLKGLTYEPVWDTVDDFDDKVPGLFPDLGVWNCTPGGILNSPDEVKNAALYLTATSTSMDDSDIDTTGLPQATSTSGLPGPISEAGADAVLITTSKPWLSEAATTLPETSPGNSPASKDAIQTTSANGIIDSKQVPSNPSIDAATASLGIASDNLPTSAVHKLSLAKPTGSEQMPSLTTSRLPPIAPAESPGQAAATASKTVAVSSTDEQGHVASSVAHLPAVGFTATNPQDFPIATMSPVVESAPVSEAAPIILDSHTISRDSNTEYLVPGQSLTPGSPVSLGSGAGATPIAIYTSSSQTILVVGASTSTLAVIPTLAAAPAVTIGNQVLTTNPEDQMVVGTQTLAPGVVITLGSGDAATPVVIHTSSSHTILIVGSITSTLLPIPTWPVAPAPTIGSQILAANSEGQYVVGGQTLAPGSPVTLGSGSAATPVLLQTTSILIGSSTSTLKTAAATAPQPITIGSQFISVNSQNQYIVGSQTLAPGSPITLGSGAAATPVLLQTTGSQTVLIAGSITSTLAAAVTAPQPITIGGQVVTANAEDQYIVDSQTLTPGGAITVSGTPVSLAPSGTQVVVGTSTEALGNYIMSGFGAGPSGSASGALPFTGAARRQVRSLWRSVILGSGVVGFLVWL